MAAGMGAGIAAIFRAPLAGTMFAAEVLYRSPEFESEVIIPAGFASVVSYCVFGAYSGWEPLFTIPDLAFTNPWQLGPYLLLALFMALLAMLYTRSFYGMKAIFDRLPIRRHFRPAVGALLTGLVGLLLYFVVGRQQQVLAVLAFGYSAIQDAMTQDVGVSAGLLLTIALGKILTTGLTIGSGGSGGVFGPSMVIGGCGGSALGIVLHDLWPSLVPHPASFVIVGMAGFFAAAAKTPFSTLDHRERDDRRIPPAAAVALGLRALLHSLRRTVDLLLPGRGPISFTGTPGELRAAGVGRGPGERLSLAGQENAGCSIPMTRCPLSSVA